MTLTGRERLVVTVGLMLALAAGVARFVVMPLLDDRARLERKVAARSETLAQVTELAGRYRARGGDVPDVAERLARRPPTFSLFTHLEAVARENGVADRVTAMRPLTPVAVGPYRKEGVAVELDRISLAQLVRFLDRLEDPQQLVFLDRLAVRVRAQDDRRLTARLEAATYLAGKEDQ